ncbi:MAG: M23 family metallopeptidase [Spirochaetes bacterium]|nr:M23 family metallopeptidase [Spirochaetota bacterium]
MNRRISFYISIFLTAAMLASFRWPMNNGIITSSFCESRWDHFHDGIDMTSIDGKVFPVEAGTLVFYWDKSLFPLDNYPGGGNYKILAHRDGLYSIYMHLENGMSSKKIYTIEDSLGFMGNTGHSFSRHLHFSIIKPRERTSINPMKLLPAFPDMRPPVISDIAFPIGGKQVIVRDNSNIRLTQHYPLLVKITDSIAGRESLGIYRLSVTVNGKKAPGREFDAISFTRGRLDVGGKGFENLFDPAGYYRVEGVTYSEGENVISVVASDFAGNRIEKEFRFNARLDMQQ